MTTPTFLRAPDENFATLANFPYQPHYVDINGLRMHYIDEGPSDGPVVLMLHGMPTWSYLYRTIIKELVTHGYRCIAPDHIGFGRSDKVTDPSWYNIARHTANMKQFIETLDLTNITIMVQDWGGPIGLSQVAHMPERFARLCIMNTWLHHEGYEYTPGILQWIQQWSVGGLLEANIPEKFTLGGLMAMATARVTPQDSLGPSLRGETATYSVEAAEVKDAYDAPFKGLDRIGHAGPYRFPMSIPHHDMVAGDAANQEKNFAIINALKIPIHFMWGNEDFVFVTQWGRQWSSMIPHATFEEIDGARHFLQDTHGTEIAQRLLSHFNA
ncbi:MAG: alpha/beta fold hydrolase [Actinobacteria bacterium]|nr:alpha/beta fold hydrolase [Actinomycetota bacterium]